MATETSLTDKALQDMEDLANTIQNLEVEIKRQAYLRDYIEAQMTTPASINFWNEYWLAVRGNIAAYANQMERAKAALQVKKQAYVYGLSRGVAS